MRRATLKVWLGVALGVVFTTVAVVGVLNLTTGHGSVKQSVKSYAGVQDAQFLRDFQALLGAPLVAGNRIDHLENGGQIFPAMLKSIHAARSTITFETYIYWSGAIGRKFADAFSERARAGVRVHVLLDWVGSQKADEALIDEMIAAGVEVERFRPLHWYSLGRMNNRTHRKLLVVDGKVGFTGGVGIADQWLGDAENPDQWRDSHYRVEGPVVAALQGAFSDNWTNTRGVVLQGARYFPQLEPAGESFAQLFSSSPEGGGDSMQLMYLMLLAAAQDSVDLAAAYFVPDEHALGALRDALERGVRVRILVPGHHIDQAIVRPASRASWGQLLEAGAEIHEFMPTTLHSKMLVVDRQVVSVGSTNFDYRSFRLNDEASLNLFDPEFAEHVSAVFERDLLRAKRISLEEWQDRPWSERLQERFARIFASQL